MVTCFWNYYWHKFFHPSRIKIDLSYHPFTTDDIFEVTVHFPPRCTIDIVAQYCEHCNISYISQSTNNSPWNHDFPEINSTDVWIIFIVKKEPTTFQQVMEAISIQQLIGKFKSIHVITSHRYMNILQTSFQENRSIKSHLVKTPEKCLQESEHSKKKMCLEAFPNNVDTYIPLLPPLTGFWVWRRQPTWKG